MILIFDAALAADVGKPAPDFTLVDLAGATVSLAAQRGRTVVLEWFNPDCPFVKYAHGEDGPLRAQPARAIAGGVVWLAINSGAPGKQGTGAEHNRQATAAYGMDYPVLLDETGAVGRSYGAQTTPHMYVVSPEGVLAYAGALDSAPLGRSSGDLVNYVDRALAELTTGVATTSTKPYGCSVKY